MLSFIRYRGYKQNAILHVFMRMKKITYKNDCIQYLFHNQMQTMYLLQEKCERIHIKIEISYKNQIQYEID